TVDVLSQKLNFGVALFRQLPRFSHHALAGAAALRAAGKRYYAIGARLIAALDDRDVGAMRIVAAGERGVEGLFGIQRQAGDAAMAGFELDQHLAEPGITGGPGDEGDVRRPVEDFFALLLGDASKHTENLAL